MSRSVFFPVSRKENIVIQELENEILVYDLNINKAFCLNETSASIWQKCDGSQSISDITQELKREFGPSINEEFVSLALNQLNKNNLLENSSDVSTLFGKVSRRQLIQKVGSSSLVALPIVSSLIAPKAVHAQSCGMAPLANGCPCTTQGSCATGCCGTAGVGCLTPNSLNVGDSCRSNCNCPNNCCGFGNQCAAIGSVTDGNPCRVDCECASGDCSGGTCLAIP